MVGKNKSVDLLNLISDNLSVANKEYIMTQNTAERMAMIRAAAQKFQKSKTKEARFVRTEKLTAVRSKPQKAGPVMDNASKDERYWTDASKYAQEWYGEVYRETTKYDNDWGDY
tara:strand:+ start:1061 stop:1402 length:342 start_codon:yes stop_codon:yes gene_type:complete